MTHVMIPFAEAEDGVELKLFTQGIMIYLHLVRSSYGKQIRIIKRTSKLISKLTQPGVTSPSLTRASSSGWILLTTRYCIEAY